MNSTKLIPSPINPKWLIPEGWEHILGLKIDYRIGNCALHLWRVEFNQHANLLDAAASHEHPHHQLLYYQRGHGRLRAAGEIYDVSKGAIFFVPAWCQHHFEVEGKEPVTCLAIDFSLDEIPLSAIDFAERRNRESELAVLLSLLHTAKAQPFQLQTYDQSLIDRCIEEIIDENERRDIGYASMIPAHLLRLIALCLRATQRANGFGRHFRHTSWRYNLLVERVTNLIRENALRTPELTLREAAKTCGTSYNHLNRILKKQTGKTFHQLLLRQRLEKAHALLAKGKLNCTEVALESGFADSNYFSRVFRKTFGYRPSEVGR